MKITPPQSNNLSLPTQDDLAFLWDDESFLLEHLISPMPTRKKRRTDEIVAAPGKKIKNISHLVSSLLMIDEEEKMQENEVQNSAQLEKALLDSAHDFKSEGMLRVQSQVEDHFAGEVGEAIRFKSKRARMTAAVTAAAAATGVVERDGGDMTTTSPKQQQQRRLWVKDRSRAWWDRCNQPDFPDSEFRRSFRMGRATFDMICDELSAIVAKEDTMLRAAIPVRQRVAVCIWRLATGEPLRLVSKRFGLGISTCHKLVLEVCAAIKTRLMPKFLQWPDNEKLSKIKQEFESLSGIPNVAGSMYTTHVPIIAPKISVGSYFNKRHTERNQKTSYSITVQGVVDHSGVFTDVCIGWPGSMPDDQIMEKSALYQRAVGGLLKGEWIVGGSNYPLMDWVLVPYTHQHLTWTQHAFNEKVGEVQHVAKEAFARLKGRWACLQKRTEVKLQDLPVVLGACCVLHNICEMQGEEIEPELRYQLVDDEMVPENGLRSVSSMQARDTIAHNLLHHGLADMLGQAPTVLLWTLEEFLMLSLRVWVAHFASEVVDGSPNFSGKLSAIE